MRVMRSVLLLSMALLLSACATSHVLTGTPRPPIDPAQVRIYFGAPPGGYEEIAQLRTASGPFTYGAQNKTDAVMRKLREEAARLGANGVLLQGIADGGGGPGGVSVGAGGGRWGGSSFGSAGVGVNISPSQQYGSGIAIWVPNPPPEQAPPPAPPRPAD